MENQFNEETEIPLENFKFAWEEDLPQASICGMTVKIDQGNKSQIYSIPDYKTVEELHKHIEEALKKFEEWKITKVY